MKIRYQVFFVFLFFLLLIAGVGSYALKISETALEESINQETLAKAGSMMDQIDKNIYDRIEIFKEYTQDLIFQEALRAANRHPVQSGGTKGDRLRDSKESKRLEAEIKEKLEYYERRYGSPIFMEVLVEDRHGRVVVWEGEDYHADMPVCMADVNGEKTKDKPTPCVHHLNKETAHMDISFPVTSEAEEELGRVYLSITLESLLGEIKTRYLEERENTKLPGMEFYLADSKGHLIYTTGPEHVGKDIRHMYGMDEVIWDTQSGIVTQENDEGVMNQYAHIHSRGYRDYRGMGWSLITKHPLDEVFRPIQTLRYTLFLALFAVLAVGFLAALLAARVIVRPVVGLKEAAEKIAKGEFAGVDAKAYGELGELIETFNKMAADLKAAQVQIIEEMHHSENARLELRENEEQLAAITNSAQDAIIMVDPTQRIVFANPSTSKILGYSKAELAGMDAHELIEARSFEQGYAAGLDIFTKSGGGPIMGRTQELVAIARGGRRLSVELSISSVFYKEQWYSIGILRDISERKENEAALRRQEELMIAQSRQAAMGEMISMIAHQWRQPLTTIGLSSDNMLLDIDMGEFNTETMKQDLLLINKQIQYLSKTINDFSDFLKPEREIRESDLNDMARQSLAIIGKSLENSNIAVKERLHAKTKLTTYPNEFVQVLLNLLNNAKDAVVDGHVADPVITMETAEDKEQWIFKICDNGGGVPATIVNRIYEPYFTTKEINGTGLGLYMSKIIIEKHLRGTLTYESINDGACFEIRLPKK